MENDGVITNATDWRSHAKQGRCIYNGLPITIENERGSYRQGTDDHGKPWRTFMHIAYGYIQLTEGVDGDHVDVYLGPNEFSNKAFVVHQVDPKTGKYDEDKVMLGFNDASAAKANYVRQYDSAKYFGTMDMYDMDTFKRMLVERRGLTIKKSLEKAKRMPVGTVSRGRKKVAEGKWVPVKQEQSKDAALRSAIDKYIQAGGKFFESVEHSGVIGAGYSRKESKGLKGAETKAFKRASNLYHELHPEDKMGQGLIDMIHAAQEKSSEKFPTKLDRNELIDEFGKMADKHKAKGSKISDLTDRELFIFIAGKTLDYGRSVEDSLENAVYLMKDRKKAERMFGTKEQEDLVMGKARKMPVGTISHGRKKVAEGKWIPVKKEKIGIKKGDGLHTDISKLITEERKAGVQYPIASAYKNYYEAVKGAEGKRNILSITKELDDFLKLGDKYSLRDNKLADSVRDNLFELLIQRRREVIQPYSTEALEKFLGGIKKNIETVYESKWDDVIKKDSDRRKVFQYVDSLVNLLKNPEVVGLYEESEFETIRAEAASYITLISKTAKKRTVFPFDESKYIGNLKKIVNESLNKSFPDMSLLKNDIGVWYLLEKGELTRFYWFHDLEKAIKIKSYYSPEEVKARGMRWVTIRGARVLIQGLTGGGWVVVGGAGGKLNHLKIDTILSKKEYAAKRKQVEAKRKEELRALSEEELAEQAVKRRAEIKAKRTVRQEYTTAITKVLGLTPEEIRSEVSAQQMDDLADTARQMVEARAAKPKDMKAAIEKQTQKELDKAVTNRVKSVERQALETLMNDYMRDDPEAKPSLKELLNTDKALEILAARDQFRQAIREIGKGQADVPTTLKVGDITASESRSLDQGILDEVKRTVETQKNVRLYDTLNAQALSIQKHIDQGSISAMNGLIGDLYGVGATFSTDTVENLGLEAVVRAVTIKIQQDGKGDAVSQALKEYAGKERERIVTEALGESEQRFKNADSLRALARDTFDAEAILSMASANGHALRQLTAGQRALGSAVGSLRAVASMINALEEPPADVVQIDIGKSLARARKKAKEAGLPRGSYSIKTTKEGRGKRLVLEIKKGNLNTFFERNAEMRHEETQVDRIKKHLANDGYKPPGIKESIILDPAQEAGLRFFKEQDRVILDFEAGLGKTAVGYAAAMEAMKNKGAKKVLIVTPAKLRGQMYDERKVFLEPEEQTNVRQANENVSRADRLARYEKEGIMIVGHDQLRTDSAAIKKAGFDMIIVDEIHEMTAGTGTAGRFRGMMELKDIPLKIGMSGTNIKNKKNELYRKINFIDPDHTLGTMRDFDRRYKGLNQGTGMFSEAANDAFRKEIAQWMYTQKATLPVKNEIERFRIPLTTNQRKKYAVSERTYRDEREKKLPGAAARRDARNYSIVTNEDAENNAKLNQLVKTMTNHDGEKAVVHVQGLNAMRTAKTRLEKEYGEGTVGLIHGESPPGAVRKVKAAFNDPANPLRFIVGTKSLESGHNLQGGGTVTFHLDIPDTYAAFEQRNKRIYRKGQDRDTKTYVLSGTNPLDIRKEDILETKRREMGILGNPRDIEGMDDSGFLGLLNKYEQGEALATA